MNPWLTRCGRCYRCQRTRSAAARCDDGDGDDDDGADAADAAPFAPGNRCAAPACYQWRVSLMWLIRLSLKITLL